MDVIRIVIRHGMVLVAIGLVLGMAGALVLTRLLKTVLFQVTPTDLGTFIGVSALLIGAGWIACYIPARRAARIDPQLALRTE